METINNIFTCLFIKDKGRNRLRFWNTSTIILIYLEIFSIDKINPNIIDPSKSYQNFSCPLSILYSANKISPLKRSRSEIYVYAYSILTFDLSNVYSHGKNERTNVAVDPARWLVLDLMVDALLDFRAIAFFSPISLLTIPLCIDSFVGPVRLSPRIDGTHG